MQHTGHYNINELIKAAYEGTARAKAAAEACDDGPEKSEHEKKKDKSEEKKAADGRALLVADLAEKVAEELIKQAERGELPRSVVDPSGRIPSDFGQGKQQQPLKPPMEGREPKTTTVEEPATPAGHKIAQLRYRNALLKQAFDPRTVSEEDIAAMARDARKTNLKETGAEALRNAALLLNNLPNGGSIALPLAGAAFGGVRGLVRAKRINDLEAGTERVQPSNETTSLGVGRGIATGLLGAITPGLIPAAAVAGGHAASGYFGQKRVGMEHEIADARKALALRNALAGGAAGAAPVEAMPVPEPQKVAGIADSLRSGWGRLKTMVVGQPPAGASPVEGPQHIAQSNQASIDATKGQAYAQQRADLNKGQFQEPALRASNDSTLQDAFHHSSGSKLASAQELFDRLQKEAAQ